jgi:hypothetical protein
VIGTNVVEKVICDEPTERGVSKAVWEYHIGGYQVMAKYLKDRRKRELTKEEMEQYMKVAAALRRTIEVQGEVDVVMRL